MFMGVISAPLGCLELLGSYLADDGANTISDGMSYCALGTDTVVTAVLLHLAR